MNSETRQTLASKRNTQIDGLRGIAILLVVFYHLICRYQELFIGKNLVLLEYSGDFGVAIFLLISSYYLIGDTDIHPLKKTLKKILRLWPSYIVSIIVIFVVLSFLPLPGRTCGVKDLLLNTFWINGYIGTPYVDGAHWYLTTLISLILVTGLISFFKQDNNVVIYIAWLCLEMFFILMNFEFLSKLTGGAYAGVACIGIGLKKIEKNDKKIFKWVILIIGSIGFTAIALGVAFWGLTCISLPIVYAAFKGKLMFLNNRILVLIGTISYPLYLIHQNISYSIEYYLGSFFGFYSYIYACIAFVIVMILSMLIYYRIEKPAQSLIKRI